MSDKLKMYFLIKDSVEVGFAINSACHAGAMIESTWDKCDPIMSEWYETSFKKVTCSVTDKQFEKAKEYSDWFVVTESFLDNKEVILVFKPRKEWPRFFNFLKMFGKECKSCDKLKGA
jgi:hypothetical protein